MRPPSSRSRWLAETDVDVGPCLAARVVENCGNAILAGLQAAPLLVRLCTLKGEGARAPPSPGGESVQRQLMTTAEPLLSTGS
jgi:hypothetical protein